MIEYIFMCIALAVGAIMGYRWGKHDGYMKGYEEGFVWSQEVHKIINGIVQAKKFPGTDEPVNQVLVS